MMGVGTPVAAQVKLTVCPGTACTDSCGGVTTCGGTAGHACHPLRPAPPVPGTPVPQHGATPRGLPPSSGDAGFHGTMLGDTAQGPQHGTAWARGAQPRDPCPTWLAVSPARHPAYQGPQPCHSLGAVSPAPSPSHAQQRTVLITAPPPLGCGVPSTVPRHAVPNPCPVSPWPRVQLTAANLIGAVGAIGLLVAVVAGGDAGPAGYAAELVWSTRRTGRLGGYKEQQPSARAVSPRVPTAPSHTHGSRSHLSRPRSRCPHRSATASGRSAHCGT